MKERQRTEVTTEYVCETCGAIYKKEKDARACEKRHGEAARLERFCAEHPARLGVGDIVRHMYKTCRVSDVYPVCCSGSCYWEYVLMSEDGDSVGMSDNCAGDLYKNVPGRLVMTADMARELYSVLNAKVEGEYQISLDSFIKVTMDKRRQ
jgi:hypothetical protein